MLIKLLKITYLLECYNMQVIRNEVDYGLGLTLQFYKLTILQWNFTMFDTMIDEIDDPTIRKSFSVKPYKK